MGGAFEGRHCKRGIKGKGFFMDPVKEVEVLELEPV
jgi:hypothetical protein